MCITKKDLKHNNFFLCCCTALLWRLSAGALCGQDCCVCCDPGSMLFKSIIKGIKLLPNTFYKIHAQNQFSIDTVCTLRPRHYFSLALQNFQLVWKLHLECKHCPYKLNLVQRCAKQISNFVLLWITTFLSSEAELSTKDAMPMATLPIAYSIAS